MNWVLGFFIFLVWMSAIDTIGRYQTEVAELKSEIKELRKEQEPKISWKSRYREGMTVREIRDEMNRQNSELEAVRKWYEGHRDALDSTRKPLP